MVPYIPWCLIDILQSCRSSRGVRLFASLFGLLGNFSVGSMFFNESFSKTRVWFISFWEKFWIETAMIVAAAAFFGEIKIE